MPRLSLIDQYNTIINININIAVSKYQY